MTLGERIIRLRKGKGLSQGELAELLEVSRQSVSKWETDASVPELDKLVRLCEVFEVTLDEMVRGETPASPAPARMPPREEKTAAPYKTPATILLCMAFLVVLVLTAMGGFLTGVLFCLPFLLCGLICLVSRRRAGLRCAWAVWFAADLFMRYATSIHWSLIRMTLSYDPSWNYTRLVFAWIQFVLMVLLVTATVRELGRAPMETSRGNLVKLGLTWGVWLASKVAARVLSVLMHGLEGGRLTPLHSVYYTLIGIMEPIRLALLAVGLSMILAMVRYRKAARK